MQHATQQLPTVLFSAEEIQRRVQEVGAEIGSAYAGESLCVVGLMDNCLVFMADLLRAIPLDLTCHTVRASFDRAGSRLVYSHTELDYGGRNVLLLVDVVDTGITLSFLLDHIRERRPKSLKVCALVDKAAERKVDLRPDWVVLSLAQPVDRFLVGYGLDFDEHYRGLPYVGTIPRPAPGAEGRKTTLTLGELG